MPDEYQHKGVLAKEVIDYLEPKSNQNFVDCTLGGGGHSFMILEKIGPKGKLIAFELDSRAIRASKERLKKFKDRLIIVNKNFVHLEEEVKKHQLDISGIVLDLGLSSDQLDKADRGFSFKDHGPLDMRFDPTGQALTASDIILNYNEDQLFKIFREYGEVYQPKRLARNIVTWRKNLDKQKQKAIKTSMLVVAILRILNISSKYSSEQKQTNLQKYRIHPATKIFQALRIAVNDELGSLQKTLPQAFSVLQPAGRLAVISFHSLEDRIVKNYFKDLARGCICPPESPICRCNQKPRVKIITKKGIKPSSEEIKANPRSRSAILRVIEKI
ncbi:16S rRNA (cytosine(1402)-N(4))-methyltransferase RsmH [Patescibacteria group bacterium]|nr:16S rRNA (cytosine(1402)-N(4))-methyltransferase RsmH [Patescibacteria group bacterium]